VIFDGFSPVEGSPLYRQIIRHIQRGLAAGTIRYGDELPSRRTLSALLGVNPNTVQKAYRLLEEEGIITSHTGAKSLVAADAQTVERVRRELLSEEAGALVRAMREMGVDREEALDEIRRLWDAPPEAEKEDAP
jgi:GntR family transcriptional regulator